MLWSLICQHHWNIYCKSWAVSSESKLHLLWRHEVIIIESRFETLTIVMWKVPHLFDNSNHSGHQHDAGGLWGIMHTPKGGGGGSQQSETSFLIKSRKKWLSSFINDVSPPRILKLVDRVVWIFLGGPQTQHSMVLICCSLSTFAAAVHHLGRKTVWIKTGQG